MLGGRPLKPEDYLAILRRRFLWILIPAVLVPILVYAASLRIPNVYTSKTLVLVEQQKVPGDFVRPVITGDLASRLSTMQEQILSRTRLQPVIERFGLFKKESPNAPMETLVDKMRAAIIVAPIIADDGAHSGISGFSISVTLDDPKTAQQVCAEITSMFMDENLRQRERSAEGTTKFLTGQLDDAKQKLDEQDAKLADFERRYVGQLPGQEDTNLNLLHSMTGQLQSVSDSIDRLQQEKSYAENMLNQQLAVWKQSQSTANPVTMQQQLENLQSKLVGLQARYTDTYPDVVHTKRDIAALKQRIAAAEAAGKDPSQLDDSQVAQEPAAIQQLRYQIHQDELNLVERGKDEQRIQKQIQTYQSRVQLSPAIEQEYKQLTRNYQTALDFYNDMLKKSKLSEIATDLERQQQGEQFRVMDPPNLPSSPSYPNRSKFAMGGVALGLMLGFGIALLLEFRDKALRTEADVQFFLQVPTIALLPDVGNNHRNARRPRARGKLLKRSKGVAPTRMGA